MKKLGIRLVFVILFNFAQAQTLHVIFENGTNYGSSWFEHIAGGSNCDVSVNFNTFPNIDIVITDGFGCIWGKEHFYAQPNKQQEIFGFFDPAMGYYSIDLYKNGQYYKALNVASSSDHVKYNDDYFDFDSDSNTLKILKQ